MGGLPSGLVTFLFTDIEGSTRHHQRIGSGWAAVLSDHDRLLAEAIVARGGVVVSRTGDGVFAAFDDTTRAVAAAADIQRAVAGYPWPDGTELMVRVGLHRGMAAPAAGDYVALPVHQAARVVTAAYGGQVLATAEVAGAAPEPAGAHWCDLGPYRLKDFDENVQLLELVVDDLGRQVGGTRAAPAAAHNVPEVHTSFIARDEERAELTRLLTSRTRLVTLRGPGGVGKTRLAFEAVKAVARSYADGAWVVLLSNATNARDVDDQVLRTLRIPERAQVSPRDTLLSVLQQRETLLLLDNAEQVADDVSRLVRRLLDECPRVSVLVTSRHGLGLDGEVELRLPPLPVTADDTGSIGSVELFIQRAAERNPALMIDAGGRRLVEEICRRLDGLPLAIELAAGRTRHMTLRDLADRLHERLVVAAADARELDERQRTLHALVDWSYRLLSPVAQSMLRRMSVMEGPASLEGVEALADAPVDATNAVAELVDKSLVSFDTEAEWPYRMLVTIRHFARQQLGDGDEALQARRRHARFFVRVALRLLDGLDGRDAEYWLTVADQAHDDFAAAMRFAESDGDGDTLGELAHILARCLYNRGRFTEARAWVSRAVRLPSSPPIRASLLTYGGYLLSVQGETEEGRRWSEEGVALAVGAGNDDLLANARRRLAIVLLMSGEYAAANAELASAMRLPVTPQRHGQLLEVRGMIAHLEGDYETAIVDTRRACDLHRVTGWAVGLPNTLDNLGASLVQVGRLDEAESTLREALELVPATETATLSHLYLHLAQVYEARGDSPTASLWATKALALARQDGHAYAIQEIEQSGLVDATPAPTVRA